MSVTLIPPSTIQVQSSILEYCRGALEQLDLNIEGLTLNNGIRPAITKQGEIADGNFEHRVALAILQFRPLIEVELIDDDLVGATDDPRSEPEEY